MTFIAPARILFILPTHTIWSLNLELFRHALTPGHLLYQLEELGFSLLVNVRQIAVQLATQLQTGVESPAVSAVAPKCQQSRFQGR